MRVQKFPLSPPGLEELAEKLQSPLSANYEHAEVSVITCPDLRKAPFHLATEGLSGEEKIADVGGQPNLFPRPLLDKIWSLPQIARGMEMSPEKGSLIGAGAGPFHVVGQNCELAPDLSWQDGFENVKNNIHVAEIKHGDVKVEKSQSLDCTLMINLFGSLGNAGPVLKITARKRRGAEKSFTECIRHALNAAYGGSRMVSLGGTFLIKSGRAYCHIMPDFPPEEDLPFADRKQLNDWLTYHDFDGPIVFFSVLHSADPEKLGLRMEHSHGYSPLGNNVGGHYHYDVDRGDEIEYEAYFNTAKVLYRLDQPTTILNQDLHD